MSNGDFLSRVFRNLMHDPAGFQFRTWSAPGRATGEAVGVLPIRCDPERMVACIMDTDHYVGNVDHVVESRTVADAAFAPPQSVHFYQRIKIPLLSELQMENALEDLGEREGWRVISWRLLQDAMARLSTRKGARFDYNDGAWLIRPDAVGYALSSAPLKSDVGRIKYALMTKGAAATAPQVVKNNIQGMVRWSKRSS